MRTFYEDYETGVASEDKNRNQFPLPNLRKTEGTHPFDFYNEDSFVELKTRSNTKDKYPTTMVSQSKVLFAQRHPEKKFYFAFCFTDGLYWIPYDPEVFASFEVRTGGRWDRGRAETNQYCYIPVEKLQQV